MTKTAKAAKPTRIQTEKRRAIFDAALDVFSTKGLRGATLEEIAAAAGLSKQNVVYYFASKDAIYTELLESLLESWLSPLQDLSADGDPLEEILTYVRRKLRMSQEMPRESRLFATEVLQGAPRTAEALSTELRDLVDDKAALIAGWVTAGKIAPVDPYHLIFSIWAMTQHYADFDVQVQAILGPEKTATRFDDAQEFLTAMFVRSLRP